MESQNAEIEKPCGYCSGTGNAFEGLIGGVACPVCSGCGKVNVPVDAVPHDMCKGQGKIKMRGSMGKQFIDCTGCRGTGWISHSQL